MPTRVVVLGAGFGGLELTTILSDAFGDAVDIVLIDKSDAFVFGFSKLDVMFGRQMPAEVRHPYRDIVKPGVRFLQSTVRSIDPKARRVVDRRWNVRSGHAGGGAGRRPRSGGHAGAGGRRQRVLLGGRAPSRVRDVLPRFERGPAIIGVTGKSFKCPPAPSETALLLHDYLVARGTAGGDRNLGGDALRHAHSPFARDLAGDPRRLRGARHPVREGQPGEGARPGAQGGRAE